MSNRVQEKENGEDTRPRRCNTKPVCWLTTAVKRCSGGIDGAAASRVRGGARAWERGAGARFLLRGRADANVRAIYGHTDVRVAPGREETRGSVGAMSDLSPVRGGRRRR